MRKVSTLFKTQSNFFTVSGLSTICIEPISDWIFCFHSWSFLFNSSSERFHWRSDNQNCSHVIVFILTIHWALFPSVIKVFWNIGLFKTFSYNSYGFFNFFVCSWFLGKDKKSTAFNKDFQRLNGTVNFLEKLFTHWNNEEILSIFNEEISHKKLTFVSCPDSFNISIKYRSIAGITTFLRWSGIGSLESILNFLSKNFVKTIFIFLKITSNLCSGDLSFKSV